VRRCEVKPAAIDEKPAESRRLAALKFTVLAVLKSARPPLSARSNDHPVSLSAVRAWVLG